MDKEEIQFTLAEAAVKNFITGDADAYYRTGITYSMQRWGVSQTDIDAYLAQPAIALPADNPGKLAMIATQKWIGLFTNATEAYLELRRTQLPDIFNNGNLNGVEFPNRFRYPANEPGQNKDAYDLGVTGLSPATDNQYSKIWLLQ